MDFGRILGRFLEGFDLTMIRATKGMSMDGWMDGVDLIIWPSVFCFSSKSHPRKLFRSFVLSFIRF